MEAKHFKYIVLGGGISGLTAALELQSEGEQVAVFEEKSSPGGVLQSVKQGAFLWDSAAHTLAVDEELRTFFDKYEISAHLEQPSQAAKIRQIAINGEIWDISNHPMKIMSAKFLSLNAKFKFLRELFKRPIKLENPTVYEFFDYHFGAEITRNIVSAVFAGIYAGDIEKLEMRSVMSKVFEIEQESGSIIKGLVKNKDKFGGREILGIKGGMEVIGQNMAKQISYIHYNCSVSNIHKNGDKFELRVGEELFTCDYLISTLPSYSLSPIIGQLSEKLQEMLDKVQYSPMVLIHVGFSDSSESNASEAFGFLCGQFSSPVFKGAIYNSDLFKDRAPNEGRSFTIFMKPNLEWLEDEKKLDQEIRQAIAAFKKLTNITSEPVIVERSIWEKAIPQFNKPYGQLRELMLGESDKVEGFTLSGSYISGVSVPDCIKYNIGVVETLTR